jgi:hypothetical protein
MALQLDDLSRDDLLDLMADCSKSTKATAKVFFPERFTAPFDAPHDEVFDAIDSGEKRIVIAEPRGVGKTSIVGLALTARKILFQQARFIPYISQSEGIAVMQTENLKMELMTNPLIQKLFGSIKSKAADGVDESFSRRSWVASVTPGFGTFVFPRGSGQQIRGVLYRNARPDLIVVDDLEEAKTITNEDIRRARKEWFDADVLGCVSNTDPNWQIVYIDTLKHEDALIESLLKAPGWLAIRHELCNDNLESQFPSMVTNETIKLRHDYYKDQGTLDVFYREFRNIPISKEDASFKQEYFQYYNETELDLKDLTSNINNIVIVDPAKTVKLQSADSAIVGIGVDRTTRKVYIRDVVSGKMYPDELYDAALNMCRSLKAQTLAVEVTSLNEFISQPFKNQMRVRGIMPLWCPLNARGKKEERIAALVPYYRQGFIYHNPNCSTKLESQLLGFPRSKLWDVMDATAYIVEFLEKMEHYFELADYEPDGSPEDEFNELENEPAFVGWRVT